MTTTASARKLNCSTSSSCPEHAVAVAQLSDDLLKGVPALLHVIAPVSPMMVDA
jgi:hypothetical protein